VELNQGLRQIVNKCYISDFSLYWVKVAIFWIEDKIFVAFLSVFDILAQIWWFRSQGVWSRCDLDDGFSFQVIGSVPLARKAHFWLQLKDKNIYICTHYFTYVRMYALFFICTHYFTYVRIILLMYACMHYFSYVRIILHMYACTHYFTYVRMCSLFYICTHVCIILRMCASTHYFTYVCMYALFYVCAHYFMPVYTKLDSSDARQANVMSEKRIFFYDQIRNASYLDVRQICLSRDTLYCLSARTLF
jgi:hypothetical protein